ISLGDWLTDWRPIMRTPASRGLLVDAFAPGGWFAANWLLWTGVEPVTSRFLVWCSTSELPIDAAGLEPITEHTSMTAERTDRMCRWSERRQPRLLSRDAGGSRTHWKAAL